MILFVFVSMGHLHEIIVISIMGKLSFQYEVIFV